MTSLIQTRSLGYFGSNTLGFNAVVVVVIFFYSFSCVLRFIQSFDRHSSCERIVCAVPMQLLKDCDFFSSFVFFGMYTSFNVLTLFTYSLFRACVFFFLQNSCNFLFRHYFCCVHLHLNLIFVSS